jgi:hypothetical protein
MVTAPHAATIIYHIRAAMPRKGGQNQFYPLGASRVHKTLCGQPVTDHDQRFSWQVWTEEIGRYTICPECVRIRAESKRHQASR